MIILDTLWQNSSDLGICVRGYSGSNPTGQYQLPAVEDLAIGASRGERNLESSGPKIDRAFDNPLMQACIDGKFRVCLVPH